MTQEQPCPFCKKNITLTPFGAFKKHIRGKSKIVCCGSGYTPDEAARIVTTKHA